MYGRWYWLGGQEGDTTHTVQGRRGGGIQRIWGHHNNNTGQVVRLAVDTWDYDWFRFGDPDARKDSDNRRTSNDGYNTKTSLAYLGGEEDGGATRISFHWGPKDKEEEEEEGEEEEDDKEEDYNFHNLFGADF